MCGNSTFSESDVEGLTSFAKEAAGLMEKYGENWAEFIDMDKRTKEFKRFEKFYKKFGIILYGKLCTDAKKRVLRSISHKYNERL